MELLAASRQDAVRQIREQLCCVLCARIFEDPQCLDCKHNFCRECIFLHLRKNNSFCPTCRLPTRPSEVTRNQFLESILATWKRVEVELGHLADPQCHEAPLTVQDTDQALQRASAGSHLSPAALAAPAACNGVKTAENLSMQGRGRVANHKWNVDTSEIRQEMKVQQPLYFQPSPMRSKSSSSDLPNNYGGSQAAATTASPGVNGTTPSRRRGRKAKRKLAISSALENGSADSNEDDQERVHSGSDFSSEDSAMSSLEAMSQVGTSSLMHTQDISSYLERINKQREALNQWERSRREEKAGAVGVESLLQSTVSRGHRSILDDEGDNAETQLPMSTTAMDSPDLLSMSHVNAFDRLMANSRRARRVDDDEDEGVHQSNRSTNGWLHSRTTSHRTDRLAASPSTSRSPSRSRARKRLRVPDSQYHSNGRIPTIRVEETQRESGSDDDLPLVVPDSQTINGNADEELEMKPAVPLQFVDQRSHQPSISSRNRKSNQRVSQDFQGAILAFQAQQHRPVSSAVASVLRPASGSNGTAEKNGESTPQPRGILNAAMLRTVSGTSVKTGPTAADTRVDRPPLGTASSSTGKTAAGAVAGFVLVGTDITREESKQIMDACHRLGGCYGRNFDAKRNVKTGAISTSVTHLVTKAVPPPSPLDGAPVLEGLRCKRTAKYMRALAEGSFVLDFAWVADSLSAGKWLSEDAYEIVGDIYSDAVGKPRESRLRRMQTGRRNDIFSVFRFVMLCKDEEFDFQLDSVRSVVDTFGGVVCWSRDYDALSEEDKARKTPIGVVSKTLPPWVAKAKWQQYQIPIVRVTWVFDSISHLEVLPFDDYYPY